MDVTYNFYDICGRKGATNTKILEELQKFGIEISKQELRDRLARAVFLGYMERKTRGHAFLSRICDRHVLTLLGDPQCNLDYYTSDDGDDYDSFKGSLVDINSMSKSKREFRDAMTMTELQLETSNEVDFKGEYSKKEDNNEEDNRSNTSEVGGRFLRECWQKLGIFIEGLEKKPSQQLFVLSATSPEETSCKESEIFQEENDEENRSGKSESHPLDNSETINFVDGKSLDKRESNTANENTTNNSVQERISERVENDCQNSNEEEDFQENSQRTE